MDTWIHISGGTSGRSDTNHRSSAVFLIKNDDAYRSIPPLAEQPPLPSKMVAAKDILSTAVSRVSTWVTERQQAKAHPLQAQELQVQDQPRRGDAKRVPRSQRLAKSDVRVDGAGAFARTFSRKLNIVCTCLIVLTFLYFPCADDADSVVGSHHATQIDARPPALQKLSKSERNSSVSFAPGVLQPPPAPRVHPL